MSNSGSVGRVPQSRKNCIQILFTVLCPIHPGVELEQGCSTTDLTANCSKHHTIHTNPLLFSPFTVHHPPLYKLLPRPATQADAQTMPAPNLASALRTAIGKREFRRSDDHTRDRGNCKHPKRVVVLPLAPPASKRARPRL